MGFIKANNNYEEGRIQKGREGGNEGVRGYKENEIEKETDHCEPSQYMKKCCHICSSSVM